MTDLGTILITGANGQIGSELSRALGSRFKVITSDIREPQSKNGDFVKLDVTNFQGVERVVKDRKVDTIFHLAAILSAKGEEHPAITYNVNVGSLQNILKVAADRNARVFWPSSIAVFGPDAQKDCTPQDVALKPLTMYGVTKVAGELLCNYFHSKYGLDVRCVRLPGIVSSEVIPSGGTTDYAVEMLFAAARNQPYKCFVNEDTALPMMYIPDCIQAAIELMDAESSKINTRTGYNINGLTFSAKELEMEIKKHVPNFVCEYEPDYRQKIAETWPHSIDDSEARKDWGWRPHHDLRAMVADMIRKIKTAN
jgi:nucleoside-diphosphate-sugar epimerase